jgi:hypothetical protein
MLGDERLTAEHVMPFFIDGRRSISEDEPWEGFRLARHYVQEQHVGPRERGCRRSLLALDGDDPSSGLCARASRRGPRIDVLLATFRALGGSARQVALELRGDCAAETALLGKIDSTSSAWGRRERLQVADGSLTLELPDQSVTWLQLTCPRPTGDLEARCLTGTTANDDTVGHLACGVRPTTSAPGCSARQRAPSRSSDRELSRRPVRSPRG